MVGADACLRYTCVGVEVMVHMDVWADEKEGLGLA